jgi:hypothetical protein
MEHLKNIRTIGVIALFTLMLYVCACERFSSHSSDSSQSDSITVVDSTEDDYTSVQEWLTFRQDLIDAKFNDSVFLAIPEPVLTFILVQCGTKLEVSDIVKEYVSHKHFYDETVLKAMETQKQITPDSLPKLPNIGTPTTTPDSI